MNERNVNVNHWRLVRRLGLVAVLMFGFGFALVPLYDVFCEITGLNGKTSNVPHQLRTDQQPELERQVRVQFIATNNESVSWEFRPQHTALKVHPGQSVQTFYYARNTAGRDMTVQAVPSVSPGLAAGFFNKMECFCFERQTLKTGEEREMPLRFVVSPELPEDMRTVTLSYTLFDVSVLGGGTQNTVN